MENYAKPVSVVDAAGNLDTGDQMILAVDHMDNNLETDDLLEKHQYKNQIEDKTMYLIDSVDRQYSWALVHSTLEAAVVVEVPAYDD
jgi:hypothetical protein